MMQRNPLPMGKTEKRARTLSMQRLKWATTAMNLLMVTVTALLLQTMKNGWMSSLNRMCETSHRYTRKNSDLHWVVLFFFYSSASSCSRTTSRCRPAPPPPPPTSRGMVMSASLP